MLSVLDDLLERCQSVQKKRGESQLSMWGESGAGMEERYPEIDEFSESQLIAFEKETIGFYISRHPLARFQEAIRRHTSDDTSTLAKRKNGGEVKVCGVVSDLKEIMTKKGDRMGFLTLEDMKGFVEVILFPEVFKACLPLLRGGDPIVVRGTLDQSEDHVKIKATDVHPLPEIPDPSSRAFHVKVPLSAVTPSQLEAFKGMIVNNRGGHKVILHLTAGDEQETTIAFSDRYTVEPSPHFQDYVRHLFQVSQISVD
jgi:DNA polymerase-3 subunit alpha